MLLDDFVPDGPAPSFAKFWGKNGRSLYAPNESMSELQRNLLAFLRSLGVAMPRAHGSIPGRSVLTNVAPHRYNRYFYLVDISKAYEACQAEVMTHLLMQRSIQLRREVTVQQLLGWLQIYCFQPGGGLYTGGAASPMLFNIYATVLIDDVLGKYLRAQRLTYTRYMDDLTFSSKVPIGERKRAHIRGVIREAGFEISFSKTRKNIDLEKGPICVTGVVLHPDAGMRSSKRARNKASGAIALALSGEASPATAHGQMGAVLATTSGNKRSTEPAVVKLRAEQLRLPKLP